MNYAVNFFSDVVFPCITAFLFVWGYLFSLAVCWYSLRWGWYHRALILLTVFARKLPLGHCGPVLYFFGVWWSSLVIWLHKGPGAWEDSFCFLAWWFAIQPWTKTPLPKALMVHTGKLPSLILSLPPSQQKCFGPSTAHGSGTISPVPSINQSWLLILFLRYSCLSVGNCCSLQSS